MIRVTIFNEFLHERESETVRAVYPEGIHMALKKGLESEELRIRTITLDDVLEGISEELLRDTDVMIWWGHKAHKKVPDEVAQLVTREVFRGMGIIFLHSGHQSKPFVRLMGTSGNLQWREDGSRELLWVCDPTHPIAQGIDRFIKLDHEEMYSEPFDIPNPDQLVFISNFSNGEVIRSGCCYRRGYGKVFYFRPGHEEFPTYYNEQVLRVIRNAIEWAKPVIRLEKYGCKEVPMLSFD